MIALHTVRCSVVNMTCRTSSQLEFVMHAGQPSVDMRACTTNDNEICVQKCACTDPDPMTHTNTETYTDTEMHTNTEAHDLRSGCLTFLNIWAGTTCTSSIRRSPHSVLRIASITYTHIHEHTVSSGHRAYKSFFLFTIIKKQNIWRVCMQSTTGKIHPYSLRHDAH